MRRRKTSTSQVSFASLNGFESFEPGRAAFTTRFEGSSRGRFGSLNLSDRVGDDPRAVDENRKAVADALGIGSRWSTVEQVHGSRTVRVPSPDADDFQADALITDQPGVVLAVFVADCVPLALFGDAAVGVVHAGWRGLSAGVVSSAIDRLKEIGGPSILIRAAVGPCIGPCHYQVGVQVPDSFANRYPDAPSFMTQGCFDLKGAVEWVLTSGGVSVDSSPQICTYCNDNFYSHRRDGPTGRQAVLAWL